MTNVRMETSRQLDTDEDPITPDLQELIDSLPESPWPDITRENWARYLMANVAVPRDEPGVTKLEWAKQVAAFQRYTELDRQWWDRWEIENGLK